MASSIPPLAFEALEDFAVPTGRLAMIAGRMIDGFGALDWRTLAAAAAAARAELAAIESQLAAVERALQCGDEALVPTDFLARPAPPRRAASYHGALPSQTHAQPGRVQ